MSSRAAGDALGRIGGQNGAGSECVETHDAVVLHSAHHIDAAGAAAVGLEGMVPQPLALGVRSAVELRDFVGGGELLDFAVAAGHTSSRTVGDSSSLRRRGSSRSGRSNAARNASQRSGGSTKTRRSASTVSAVRVAEARTNSEIVVSSALLAASSSARRRGLNRTLSRSVLPLLGSSDPMALTLLLSLSTSVRPLCVRSRIDQPVSLATRRGRGHKAGSDGMATTLRAGTFVQVSGGVSCLRTVRFVLCAVRAQPAPLRL